MTEQFITDFMQVCSFCGKTSKEIKFLIAGPRVSICDECIGLCVEIIEDNKKSKQKIKIDWKRHAKRFYSLWKGSELVADAHYGRYRKWKDRAKRAEERKSELEDILAEEGVNLKFKDLVRKHKDPE